MSAEQILGDLEGLTQRVLSKAQAKAQATLEQAQRQAEGIMQEAEAQAKEREEELIRAGMNTVERARKRIISQAQLRLRDELLERKAAILTDIIDEVRRRFEQMRSDEKYLDLLLALVRGALTNEPEPGRVSVYLNEKDLQKFGQKLQRALKELGSNEVELLPARIGGGAIIELPERRLQFDSSLERILQEFKPQVERLVQEEVFTTPEASQPPEEHERGGDAATGRGEGEHGNDAD